MPMLYTHGFFIPQVGKSDPTSFRPFFLIKTMKNVVSSFFRTTTIMRVPLLYSIMRKVPDRLGEGDTLEPPWNFKNIPFIYNT